MGSHPVTVTVSDGQARKVSVDQSYTLTVTNVNDAPVVSGIPNQTVAEGSSFTTITLDTYVTDPDNADSEMGWTYSGNSQLSVTITNRVATITIPNSNWNGSENIIFTATDPGGLADSDTATFTVSAVNDPPVFTSTPVTQATEDLLYSSQATAELINHI